MTWMNVLFFTHHLNKGGAEKTVRTLSEYLNGQDNGITSHICVVYDDPALKPYPANVHVLRHASNPEDGKLYKALNVLRQIREMRRLKKELAIDACVSFLPGADVINVLSGAGEKQIVSVRNLESRFTHSVWKKWYDELSYRLCDRIAACSETVRQDCIGFFGVPEHKIVTIHNSAPVMPETGMVPDDYRAFTERHFTFINVARLSSEKGQIHLLRAFAALVTSGSRSGCPTGESVASEGLREDLPEPNQRAADDSIRDGKPYGLVLVGDGPLMDTLRQEAEVLGIRDRVWFAGRQAYPMDYLKRADVFVLPSNAEGMPNVLLEALEAGLPCIATECGAREILAPETDPVADRTSAAGEAKYGILVPVCGTETTAQEVLRYVSGVAGASLKTESGHVHAAGSSASEVNSGGELREQGEDPVRVPAALSEEERILAEAMEKLAGDAGLRAHYREMSEQALKPFALPVIASQWERLFHEVLPQEKIPDTE